MHYFFALRNIAMRLAMRLKTMKIALRNLCMALSVYEFVGSVNILFWTVNMDTVC